MIKDKFLSICIWIGSISLTILLYLAMLLSTILFPFDKKRKIAHAQCFWWADAIIALNPFWQLKVTGLENIDHNKTYVVVANHQSLADIIVMYKTRMQFKWVAKEDLFSVPFVGWSMTLARHIRLSRGKFSSIKHVYREADDWLKNKISVVFFPEGTRSQTGEMGEFQNGAFKLAIKEKVPILPVSIEGTRDVIPKGNWICHTRMMGRLRVLPPIDTINFATADFARLKDLARQALEKN